MAKGSLAAASKAIDPTLNALFSSSSGPVKAPPKSRYAELIEKKARAPPPQVEIAEDEDEDEEVDDEELSELSEELDDEVELEEDDEEEDDQSSSEASGDSASEDDEQDEGTTQPADQEMIDIDTTNKPKERKRKRKDAHDDLEDKYMTEILRKDAQEHPGKRQKGSEHAEVTQTPNEAADDINKGNEILSDGDDSDEAIPVHESLQQNSDSKSSELDKAARTVFIANVSSEVIASKSAKKTLEKHLLSCFDESELSTIKIESIRFRSVAFSTGAMPKRAAYITKAIMDSTTKSTNAYAVFSTQAAARKVVSELNGSEVLGRHIRLDSVAHPSPTDHRRCVFVGNLGFVDDETIVTTNEDGETKEKKRNKVPSDIEEGLWRTFGKQGKVENVRVVRDSKTRVGKGFAYVQFYDANDVEAALLLDGKKFPPMLPRAIRVTRAKDPRKTNLAMERAKTKSGKGNDVAAAGSTKYRPKATAEQLTMAGRNAKLLGRAAANGPRRHGSGFGNRRSSAGGDGKPPQGMKTPEQIVFEGRRASANDGLPKDLKFGKKGGKGGKPKNRSARRGGEWKKRNA